MATPRPFPVDAVTTAIAIGYSNPVSNLVADDVLPRIPVVGEKFKWLYYPAAQMFTLPDTRVGRTGRVNRVEFRGLEQTAAIDDFGLEDAIPVADAKEAERMREAGLGSFDPELTAAAGLTNLILLDREVRAAALVQDPANYPPSGRMALSGSSKFDDYAGSAPIDVLKDAFSSTLVFRPNTLSMSRNTWSKLSSHPHIVNAIKGNATSRGIVSRAEFLQLFEGEGLLKLCIGEAFVNTARKGQAGQISRVWGNSIQLTYLDPTVRPEQGGATWGFTATYGSRIGGRWYDPNVGLEGGTVVRIGERVKEVVAAPGVGFIIQNVVTDVPAPILLPAP